MKKFLIGSALIVSFVFSNCPCVAEETAPIVEQTKEIVSASNNDEATQDNSPLGQAERKHVGKASEEASKAASSRAFQNIMLASAAIIVAVVAIVIVSHNEGSPAHNHQ